MDASRQSLKFVSILFSATPPDAELEALVEPDYFGDLNLDQVLARLTQERRGEYHLEPFFYFALSGLESVVYRQDICRDLERDEVRAPIDRFAAEMLRTREHLGQAEKLRHALQKQAWLLDAIAIYCDAVEKLASELAELDLKAAGLRRLGAYLTDYARSQAFVTLAAETRSLERELHSIEYALHIDGLHVTVEQPQGQPDYGSEVEAVFVKFAQSEPRSHRPRLRDFPDMTNVEERILDRIAKLDGQEFTELAAYCKRNDDFLDSTLARFDREVQLYLGYLDLIEPLRAEGLPFSYPELSPKEKEERMSDSFDLALALKLVSARAEVVTNDFELQGPERVFVVTGPNNGGKTTFARTVGQLHHLAALGLPVAGSSARLFLPDRIFSHFEQEEDVETLRGKFEDELIRVHRILEQASPASLIVMNESFSSTTLDDARTVGEHVLGQILELGALGVYVTFVDELASLSEATVSMVSQVVPTNPAQRTFKLIRMEANGLAYAWAIAEKYSLTYERLLETIPL